MFAFIMVQILKDHIRQGIIEAALQEFAEQGYEGASIAIIAARAGVSTGNVYRYFKSKAKLFDAVMPKSFVETFEKKLHKRVNAYPIGTHPDSIPKNSQYAILSEELYDFIVENRLRVIILFEGSAGTDYESFGGIFQSELKKKVVQHIKLDKLDCSPVQLKALIDEVYANLGHAWCMILRRFSEADDIKTLMRLVTAYHLGGMTMLLK